MRPRERATLPKPIDKMLIRLSGCRCLLRPITSALRPVPRSACVICFLSLSDFDFEGTNLQAKKVQILRKAKSFDCSFGVALLLVAGNLHSISRKMQPNSLIKEHNVLVAMQIGARSVPWLFQASRGGQPAPPQRCCCETYKSTVNLDLSAHSIGPNSRPFARAEPRRHRAIILFACEARARTRDGRRRFVGAARLIVIYGLPLALAPPAHGSTCTCLPVELRRRRER